MKRWDPLEEAPKNQHQATRTVTNAAKRSAGVDVEDLAALPTFVVHDRRAMTIVGSLVGGQHMSERTVQSLRMQGLHEPLVTPHLVQEIFDRYVHHDSPTRSTETRSSSDNPPVLRG